MVFKKIKEWWPILKEDCDFDYICLLEILEFKLNKMADAFEKDGVAEGAEVRANEMRLAAKYCRMLIDDDFFDHETLDKKWGEPKLVFNEDKSLTIECNNVKTDEDKKQYLKELNEEFEYEERFRQEVLNSLCGIIQNNLFKWWD